MSLQGVLFALLILMVLAWFACVRKLSRELRERHPGKFDEMGLDGVWSTDDNTKPVFALLAFLLGREDRDLGDPAVSSLATFMRWFFFVYLGLFVVLVYTILSPGPQGRGAPLASAVQAPSRPADRREEALALYRAQKWEPAIAAFDALLEESTRNAELKRLRGAAHLQLRHFDEALLDFRGVIEIEPSNFDAHRDADRILSRQQRWDEVITMWDRYIALVPADAEAYFERGGTYYHKRDFTASHADAVRSCELGKAEACAWAERLKERL